MQFMQIINLINVHTLYYTLFSIYFTKGATSPFLQNFEMFYFLR